ncbi:MAG: EAL domain-containing protein [Rhizobiales bacterium]|nr:EAL domain-containing protein [Hyphomicrobiales bacterium]
MPRRVGAERSMGMALAERLRGWRSQPDRPAQHEDSLGLFILRQEPGRLRAMAPLGLVLVAAAMLCGVVGYDLARQSDDQHDVARRQALVAAIKEFRAESGGDAAFDQRVVRLLEQASGLKGLRFDSGPGGRARDLQPVVENGRIVGWFSWDRDAPVTDVVTRLWPLVMLGIFCLSGFIGLTLWHLRRSGRALAETRAHARTLVTESHTGLPNTSLIHHVLERALIGRRPRQVVTYLLIDIDRFDDGALGHQATDEILTTVALRLKAALPGSATLGSFGGGRFAAVLIGGQIDAGVAAGQAALAALAESLTVRGEVLRFGGCVGFASAPEHGTERDDIARRAELALKAAKRDRRGRALAFNGVMEVVHDERQALRRDLKQAVATRAFDIEYQPIVAANGYRVVGVEALLRWSRPERGVIAPAVFIPLAEEGGLMDDLGDFALRRALADAKRWPHLYVAINLSPVQLGDRERVERIASLIRDSAVGPGRVVLEITEGVLIEEPERIKTHLEVLRALGARVALDDFGSGYSSLTYLRQFPIDKLKIDRGFVAPLGQSANAGAIIQAIVALGRALELSVLVEGVETDEQRVLLRLAGCDEMQGFLFAKPVPAAGIDRLLAEAQSFPTRHPRSGQVGHTFQMAMQGQRTP